MFFEQLIIELCNIHRPFSCNIFKYCGVNSAKIAYLFAFADNVSRYAGVKEGLFAAYVLKLFVQSVCNIFYYAL